MAFPKLRHTAVLSPMSGVTDIAFRLLCKRYGASVTYTQFVASKAILHGNEKTLSMIKTVPEETPVGVQLFGNSAEEVVEAAKLIEHQFDFVDINCGCPAWKVIKTGSGSALLNNPEKIATFISKLASAISKPVTVKIRAGITKDTINAVEVATLCEDAGAAAIAVHGRTQKQGYSGESDWNIIKQVKDAVHIPVIGNGDVFTPEVFEQRMQETGVDAIMIARGAISNPFLFRQIEQYRQSGTYDSPERIQLFFEYLELANSYAISFSTIKNHAVWFTKGIEGGAKLRNALSQCHTAEEITEILQPCLLAK